MIYLDFDSGGKLKFVGEDKSREDVIRISPKLDEISPADVIDEAELGLYITLTLSVTDHQEEFNKCFPLENQRWYSHGSSTMVVKRRGEEYSIQFLYAGRAPQEASNTPLSPAPTPHYWRFNKNPIDVLVMDECPLRFNKELTLWAKHLAEAELKPLGDSGIIYFDVPHSQFTKTSSPSYRVYLPTGTKECWDNLFQDSRMSWYVTGTPGIGKTVSTVYYLKLLMKAGCPVILYNTRKEVGYQNQWNAFMWYPDCYRVYKLLQPADVDKLLFLRHHQGHVMVIDMAQDSGDKVAPSLNGNTVVVSTPDTIKVGDYPKDGVTFTWLPAPTAKAVRQVCSDMFERNSSSEVEKNRKLTVAFTRCAEVGPIMRRILDDSEYEKANTNIGKFLNQENIHESVGNIIDPNMRDLSLGRKPHSYVLMITKREYVDAVCHDEEDEDKQPGEEDGIEESDGGGSEVVGEVPRDHKTDVEMEDDAEKQEEFEAVENKKISLDVKAFVVVPVSLSAVARVFDVAKTEAVRHVLSRATDGLRHLQNGCRFEKWLVAAMYKYKVSCEVRPLLGREAVNPKTNAENVTFGNGQVYSLEDVASKTRAMSIQEWKDLPDNFKSVNGEGDGFVCPNEGFPLVDFMDRRDRAGQITIDKKHSVHVKELSKSKKAFKWTKKNPLQVIYLVSSIDYLRFKLDSNPVDWIRAYVASSESLKFETLA